MAKTASPSHVSPLTFTKAENAGRIQRVLNIRNQKFPVCWESLNEDALHPGVILLGCNGRVALVMRHRFKAGGLRGRKYTNVRFRVQYRLGR